MNWLLTEASGAYVSKVDDDCLVAEGWAAILREAHRAVPELGAIGCWRFRPEDFQPALVAPKLETLAGGHRILRSCWVEGTGFLMKRECAEALGVVPGGMGFPTYCMHLAAAGWIHGWYYPFVYQEHMDDPRSPYWPLETRPPTPSPEEHVRRIRANALEIQRASLDPRRHVSWRGRLNRRRKTRILRGT
jgi:hypothetical protein